MPVIKSAKKKLKQDKSREENNNKVRALLKSLMKKAQKNPSAKGISQISKIADKAAKNHIIHKNKAAHIKSAMSRLIASTEGTKSHAKPASKTTKKAAVA